MRQLQVYYKAYIRDVRGLKGSTASHYAQAVNTASRYLRDAGYIEGDLYEITSLKKLHRLRDLLYAIPSFVKQNVKGNNMYSNGVDKYLAFAEYGAEGVQGSGMSWSDDTIAKMDRPMPPVTKKECRMLHCWNRDRIIVGQVLRAAGWKCESNPSHPSFIARRTNEAYLEGHHLIPLARQDQFKKSLDVYANIIGLCPNCHRLLHYGHQQDIRQVLGHIYDLRAPRLANSGLPLSKDEFLAAAAG